MDYRYWKLRKACRFSMGDKLMPASLLFARNEYGGANLVFNKDSITATYFANINNNQETTLIINFTKDNNDDYPAITILNWSNWFPQKKLRRSLKKN